MTDNATPKTNPTYRLALALIALGGLLLLGALGLLSVERWALLFRFWPLVAISFGLDLLGFKTGRKLSFGGISLALLAALVLLGPALGLAGGSVTETFEVPLGATRSADVGLDLGAASVQVSALGGGPDLLRAAVTHRGRVALSVRGGDRKTVRLAERGRVFGFGAQAGRWNVGLHPNVPLELSVDGGSGRAVLDLYGLELSELNLEGGSGTVDLTLPASGAPYEAFFDGGSGHARLTVEGGATLSLEADSGSGGLEVTFGENVAADLELNSGSGAVTVTLPPDAEARLEVGDRGSGAISLPPRFVQVGGDSEEGVWETLGFTEAERTVTVRLEDRGSGAIRVR